MTTTATTHYDLCVLGGSSAGLAIAIGAGLLGVPVVLIEPGPLGADAAGELATATLLAVTNRIAEARRTPGLGVSAPIDLAAIRAHVTATVEAAAAANRPERLRALGVHLIETPGRFIGPDRVAIDGAGEITARRFVVAPMAVPALPAIPGLDQVPLLDTGLETLPMALAILGGGAEAIELAQAYRRLGSAVTLIDVGELLPDQDPELVDLLLRQLVAEGVRLLPRTAIRRVTHDAEGIVVDIDGSAPVTASHLLVAAGRRSDPASLDLAAAGIPSGPAGIPVDRHLRTANRRVYAVAPDAGLEQASAQAGVALRQILFRQRPAFDARVIPTKVRTGPGLAAVGLRETEVRGPLTILRAPLHDNDRARAEASAHGLVKIVTDRKGRILGAGILAPDAAELISPWQLAIARNLKIGAISSLTMPFPSLGEASKRAAGSFFAPRLLSAGTKRLVRWLARFG
jgi:pyruvate/2-oxoglutarate dehydrogenase complex dihydrolipoamide dehydrogenase (E3) component